MDTPAVRDAALLLLRAVVGVIFVAHGWRVLVIDGVGETTGGFARIGVPQPGLSAWIVGAGETLMGAMLVVGLLSTVVAGLLALIIVAAIWFVHLDGGFAALEYPLLLLAALIMIVVFGAGRASVDGVLGR